MENNKPLLSIYIPTYNRGYYLRKCLDAIVNQEIFSSTNLIEIVISNNGCTDLTEKIVQEYLVLYKDKIKYTVQNPPLSPDRNIIRGLECVNGKFVKLCNDNLIFEENALEDIINVLQEKNPDVLFLLNKSYYKIQDTYTTCKNIDEYINTVSFFCTSISCYIFKTDLFKNFDDIYRCEKLKLTQVDVALRLLEKEHNILVYNKILFHMAPVPNKGGYNVAEIFGQNYFSILEEHVKNGSMDEKTFYDERKYTLNRHILPSHFNFSNKFNFDGKHFFRFVKHCHGDKYFLRTMIKVPFRIFKSRTVKIFKNILISLFPKFKLSKEKRTWRYLNQDNTTILGNSFDFLRVYARKDCSGILNVEIKKDCKGEIILGTNVVIEDGVIFCINSDNNIVIPDNTVIKEGSHITCDMAKESCDIL